MGATLCDRVIGGSGATIAATLSVVGAVLAPICLNSM
jgi:hypothetical protein